MIRLGTRGSDLALKQSGMVAERLRELGTPRVDVQVVIITTRGDATDRPFREIEGKAFFTKELDDALLERRIDLAVHSLKDLPTEDPPGLFTACVMPRADSRDLLLLRPGIAIGNDEEGAPTLPSGLRIGTSSARRFAQLVHVFPGTAVVDLRGNVPTRVHKLRRGDYDGIVIAAAGVERLEIDLSGLTVLPLDPPRFLPAPGQGVLACRVRSDDPELPALIQRLVDPETAACARAERKLLEKLEGGCSLPLGALARRTREGKIVLDACLANEGEMRRAHVETESADAAAEAAVRELIDTPSAPMVPTVIVTRPDEFDAELVRALRGEGLAVIAQPAIAFEELALDEAGRAQLDRLADYDVVAFTSRQAVRAFAAALERRSFAPIKPRAIAAVGKSTAQELKRFGLGAAVVSDGSGSAALSEELAKRLPRGARVLHPCAAEPDQAFADRLAEAGVEVTALPLYVTRDAPGDPPLPPGLLVAILASPSAVRSFVARAGVNARLAERSGGMKLVAGGATTAAELERLGLEATSTARTPSVRDLVPAVLEAMRSFSTLSTEE